MKFFYLTGLLASMLTTTHAGAQEEFVGPDSRVICSFTFKQVTGGVILLRGLFDDHQDTLNFILDSGSSGISLDSTTVAKLGLKPAASDRSIRGMGGIRRVPFLYNRTLHLPGIDVDSLNFHVNDYSILSSVYGENVDGIIGYSLLSRYIVKLNYDENIITICTQGPIRYPKNGYLLKPFISTLPVHYARVSDEHSFNSRFLHDIGAGVCLMLSRDFVEDSNLLKKKRRLLPKEGEGVGGSIEMGVTVVKELRLGPYRFHNVPTYVFNDTFNITSYPYLSGLIGNDIFRRFNVILNYGKRDIHLVPNSHFRDPFDYSYTGLELIYVDGKTYVADVSEKSPAEKAGLLEGDEIVGMNNDFSSNFQHYKAMLQETRNRIKIIVKRNDELLQYEFKVKTIL